MDVAEGVDLGAVPGGDEDRGVGAVDERGAGHRGRRPAGPAPSKIAASASPYWRVKMRRVLRGASVPPGPRALRWWRPAGGPVATSASTRKVMTSIRPFCGMVTAPNRVAYSASKARRTWPARSSSDARQLDGQLVHLAGVPDVEPATERDCPVRPGVASWPSCRRRPGAPGRRRSRRRRRRCRRSPGGAAKSARTCSGCPTGRSPAPRRPTTWAARSRPARRAARRRPPRGAARHRRRRAA